MPQPPVKVIKVSKCSSIIAIHSDIVEAFNFSLIVLPLMFFMAKAFRVLLKT
jgi:hypothetical protein